MTEVGRPGLGIHFAGEHEPWKPEILEAGRSLDYAGAKALLASVVALPRPADLDAFLLSLVQTYLFEDLDKAWHLGFVGGKSSGKSTALRVWAFLADKTYLTGPATSAALLDLMGSAHGVALDEVDATMERRGDDGRLVEVILRLGTDRGNQYAHRVPGPKGRGWTTVGIDPFCPAAFTYSGRLDDALTSRCDTIRMVRLADPRAVRRRARYYRRHLATLLCWLEFETGRARIRWGRGTIQRFEESTEFLREADGLRVDLPRTGEIGELMLLTARLMGWPIAVSTIQGRLDEIDASSVDDSAEEVKSAVLELLDDEAEGGEGSSWSLPTTLIRDRVNALRPSKERPITANAVIRGLREIGVEEFGRVSRSDKRRTAVVRWGDRERWRGAESPPPVVPLGAVVQPALATLEERLIPTAIRSAGDAAGDTGIPTTRGGPHPASPATPPTFPLEHPDSELEIERAVRMFGPTISYPDGTVADRRTGAILVRPRDDAFGRI